MTPQGGALAGRQLAVNSAQTAQLDPVTLDSMWGAVHEVAAAAGAVVCGVIVVLCLTFFLDLRLPVAEVSLCHDDTLQNCV